MPYLEPTPRAIDFTRGLQLLIEKGDAIQEADQTHPYWSKVKYLAGQHGLSPMQLWEGIKAKRWVTASRLSLTGRFSFNYSDWLQSQLHFLDAKSQGIILDVIGSTTVVQKKKYIISGLINEAFSSSTLEGAVSTRSRAKELIDKKIRPHNQSDRMILNNYAAMQYIHENKNKPLTLERVLELHEILGHQSLDQGLSGLFRTDQEAISVMDDLTGEVIYIPPPSSEILPRMLELVTFFNEMESYEQAAFIHPLLRACVVHFMVGHIHPFSDGNGRIARALFYWHMLKSGYWLAEYLSISQIILESKTAYYKAFAYVEADENDMTYFLLYKVDVLFKSFERLKNYLQEKLDQQDIDLPNTAFSLGITIRQAELLDAIKAKPKHWKVGDVERILNISHATARADLNALTEKGLLERFNLDKKTQAWCLI